VSPKPPPPEDLRLIKRVGAIFVEMERLGLTLIRKRPEGGYEVHAINPRIAAVTREHADFIVEAGKKAKN
jgi:hypothetical protein